ncbi:SRPBCC family protein [Pseudonocardia phyllosphaerae]|uniref:SRPBCC family protein n=1 Tax=Pseudonocardia phyllosphaerae TaxID=3390502 RepID=UPI00397C4461
MQLENKFTIAAPIEDAWKALNDPETVAPCFPGATLTEYEGDSFQGTVKVKLGPISLTYKGKGTYVERDEANHKVVIEASGRDARGNGTAKATVTGTMVADGPDKTSVTMATDMTVTGRPAQFGRGVISDVADKIISQFSSCVAEKLTGPGSSGSGSGPKHALDDETAPIPVVPPGPGEKTAPTAPAAAAHASDPAAPTTPKAPAQPQAGRVEAIDLLDSAGAPVLKRVAPALGGLVALLLVFLVVKRLRGGGDDDEYDEIILVEE